MRVYEVVATKSLAPTIKQLEVLAPLVARQAKPGQFVIVRLHERGERVPLTLQDWSPERGTVKLVVLDAGKTTAEMLRLKPGDKLQNLLGPLGNPSRIEKYGTAACVGGGVGIACILPLVKALKRAGNRVITIVGARTAELLIFEQELKQLSDELHVATDDGSKGHKGFVSEVLEKLLEGGKSIHVVFAVGPVLMMKAVADLTKRFGVKTVASLNPIMVDGTGMCGSCRVEVGGKTKFACVDGPEFDAHQVDFDLLLARNRRFLEEEALSLQKLRDQG